jgi:two-component system, chemotaxis family, chemotaxis protein CheY
MTSVLIVDDDAAAREALQRMLAAAGYDARLADNGKTAIVLFREQPTDVVLTDVMMPEMDGLELIRQLRLLDPGAKIIAMTAAAPEQATTYLKLAEKYGARQVLHKPFSKEALLTAVAEALEV